jgi:tellurite methyltransferase
MKPDFDTTSLLNWSNVDIMLIDQILKRNIKPGNTICDAGCGSGRNSEPFINDNYKLYGFDPSIQAIQNIKHLANKNGLDEGNFRVSSIENNTMPEEAFDFVICNAVLHFCNNETHFLECINSLWRLLNSKGILFCRFASKISWPKNAPMSGFSFLASRELIINCATSLNAHFVDPIKTTVVDQSRTMTTVVLRK